MFILNDGKYFVGRRLSLRLRRHHVKAAEVAMLLRQLADLLRAGIDLATALSLLHGHQRRATMAALIVSLRGDLHRGLSLSQAMTRRPDCFDALSRHLIAAGEQAGVLADMLDMVCRQHARRERMRQDIVSACLYPAVVFVAAMVIGAALLIGVVPQFTVLFAENNVPLPAPTRLVIGLADFCRYNGLYVVIFTALLIITILVAKCRSWRFRLRYDSLLLRLPIFGATLKKTALTRCLQTLGIGLAAGIPLPQALRLCADVAGNDVFRWAFLRLERHVQAGHALTAGMRRCGVFPDTAVAMIAAGEHGGNLTAMLERLCTFYRRENRRVVARLHRLLEPVMMLILGVGVSVLLLALYLPVFRLGSVL